MPFEQHPTDPDKLVMRAGNYSLQKPWVGLTDEEVIEISHLALTRVQAVQMTEAKLKEKNT